MTNRTLIGVVAVLALLAGQGASAGVVKTKTKSNQSNDRIQQSDFTAALSAEFDRLDSNGDGQLDSAEQAAVIKTKTKSNQSNDRCSGECPAGTGAEPAMLGAPLKGVDVKIGRESAARLVHVQFSAGPDSDGDGRVSKAEWLAAGQGQFALADSDHDGSVSEAEAAKFGWNIKSTEVR